MPTAPASAAHFPPRREAYLEEVARSPDGQQLQGRQRAADGDTLRLGFTISPRAS